MSKCGHSICPDTNCVVRSPFSRKGLEYCRGVKQCFETHCAGLLSLGPSGAVLKDSCMGHCHDPKAKNYPGKYLTQTEYLCANFDPVTLADYGGVNICAVPEELTKVGQLKTEEDAANVQSKKSIAFIGLIILALLFMLFWKK